MDPIEILEKIDSLYSNAFNQLITITVIVLGFGGVILPIVLQFIQAQFFRIERKALENQISTEVEKARKASEKEIERKFEIEKEDIHKIVLMEIERLDEKIKDQSMITRAGIFFLQGASSLDQKMF